MSKVPSKFQSEGPGRCGDSWRKSITVTGKIPGTNVGNAFKHTIAPIVKNVPTSVTKNEDAADELRDKITARISKLEDSLAGGQFVPAGHKSPLTSQQVAAIKWLLTHAEAEMAAAFGLFDKWRYREWGPFPMEQKDLGDVAFGDCKGKPGAYVSMPSAAGRDIQLRCPTNVERMERDADRQAILRRFMDALAHVRCAEYGFWRITLVEKARDTLAGGGGGPGDLAAEPGVGVTEPKPTKPGAVGGIAGRFIAKALEMPDVDELPPPEEIPDDTPDVPPEGAEGDPPPAPSKPSNTKAAALAVGGAVLVGLLWKMR